MLLVCFLVIYILVVKKHFIERVDSIDVGGSWRTLKYSSFTNGKRRLRQHEEQCEKNVFLLNKFHFFNWSFVFFLYQKRIISSHIATPLSPEFLDLNFESEWKHCADASCF